MTNNFLRPGLLFIFALALQAHPWVRLSGFTVANGFAESPRRGTGEERALPPQSSAKSLLTDIRFLSSTAYTRVMLGLSQETKYEVHRLQEDVSRGLPPRIYIDMLGARLAMSSKDPIQVQDSHLRQVRAGQFSQDVVRVVLDMNSLRDHKVFPLLDPYRLVIDIQGQKNPGPLASVDKGRTGTLAAKGKKPATPTMLGIRKVVLDPGHGGRDPGALGIGGIAEKDIVLSVAKRLAAKIKKEMGIEVVLTRNDDRYVPLEDRTAIANAEDADLFISLHMNASSSADAKGLETYYLDNTNDEASMRLAARENGTSRDKISDLQFILSDMTQNMKLEDSITLAHHVHGSLVNGMSKKMSDVKDLGVKKAQFYVLVGARMPSVLVELFFITHKTEGPAMTRINYQDALVEALYQGVKEYNNSTLAMKTL